MGRDNAVGWGATTQWDGASQRSGMGRCEAWQRGGMGRDDAMGGGAAAYFGDVVDLRCNHLVLGGVTRQVALQCSQALLRLSQACLLVQVFTCACNRKNDAGAGAPNEQL